MGIVVQTLTPEQISLAQQQAQTIANTATPVVQNGQFVFFAAFDGTRNDRDNLAISGDSQITNVGQLELQVQQASASNSNLVSRYQKEPSGWKRIGHCFAASWMTKQSVTFGWRWYKDSR